MPTDRPALPHLRLALSLGVLLLVPAAPLAAQGSRLAGTWKLNVERSSRIDDGRRGGAGGGEMPGERGTRGGFGGRRGGFPGGGGGGFPGGARRPRGGEEGPGGGEQDPETRELLLYVRPLLTLVIRQTDSTIVLGDASGEIQTVRTDGRTMKEPLLSGGEMETKAQLKHDKLTVERKSRVGSVTQTFEIEAGTGALVVETKYGDSRMPRTAELRRVYDPANEG